MSPEQVYLIRKSFAELSRHDHVAALIFYRRLLEIDPALRPLFTTNIEEQSRKLLDMLGSLIASLLVIEQLVGGINSMFEKYFARSMRWRSAIRTGKAIFVAALLMALPWLSKADFSPQNRHAPWMLVVIAVAGLLPLSEMFTALQRRSERFVALGSAVIAAACAAVLALAWWAGWPTGPVSLALYVAMPCLTFVFYWIASTHARHDTQR